MPDVRREMFCMEVGCNTTPNSAKSDAFDYIERFYNLKRRHSLILIKATWALCGSKKLAGE